MIQSFRCSDRFVIFRNQIAPGNNDSLVQALTMIDTVNAKNTVRSLKYGVRSRSPYSNRQQDWNGLLNNINYMFRGRYPFY